VERIKLVTSNLEAIATVMQQKCELEAWQEIYRGTGVGISGERLTNTVATPKGCGINCSISGAGTGFRCLGQTPTSRRGW
jgi:hypothetical protein